MKIVLSHKGQVLYIRYHTRLGTCEETEYAMSRFISRLLFFITIISVVAGAAYCITRFLLATDDTSGTDPDTRFGVRHEPVKRHYTKLTLPEN